MRGPGVIWMRKRGWRIVLAMLLVAGLASCARDSAEDAIRAQVAALQAAIEDRRASDVADILDADFIGPDGMDRREARAMAMALMLRHQRVGVVAGPLEIRLQGEDRATVRTRAALTGAAGGTWLPDSAQAWQVESGWRLRDGQWRITSLRWTPMLE